MRLPVYYISHGGGPWPWIREVEASYAPLRTALADIPRQLGNQKPSAILMVSAHWESAHGFTVQGHPNPSMLYDYYGFPAHTYDVRYAAPGKPELAERVKELLAEHQLEAHIDAERGFDHGAFVPAYCIYPDASVPMVQLSIHQHYDPALHIQLGKAIERLRDENVLIICSGLSYHNLRHLGPSGREPSAQFDAWLEKTLLHDTPEQRIPAMLNWENAPAARIAHAREDHLVPLFVAVGAAEHDSVHRFHYQQDAFGGITVSSYRFDALK